ncbi:hypothetical protein BGX28_007767 [Mortierella sp. GBA30]|nr:hypothetical protein BGX28_007767 [Mortierella sp. GBA30]
MQVPDTDHIEMAPADGQTAPTTDVEMTLLDNQISPTNDIEMAPADNQMVLKLTSMIAGMALKEGHPPLSRIRVPRHRHHYAAKERVQILKHEPPPVMMQYKWKDYKRKPRDPASPAAYAPQNKPAKKQKVAKVMSKEEIQENLEKTGKKNLVKKLNVEHSIVTLGVGTVAANAYGRIEPDGLSENGSHIASEITRILQKAARQAATAKRKGQGLIGGLIQRAVIYDGLVERISSVNGGADLSDKDKALVDILNLICPQISKPNAKKASFYDNGQSDPPNPTPTSEEASDNNSAQSDPSDEDDSPVDEINSSTPAKTDFPVRTLVTSSASQLLSELRRHFRKGALEIQAKLLHIFAHLLHVDCNDDLTQHEANILVL